MEKRVCHLVGDMFGIMACALTAVGFSGLLGGERFD